MPFILLIQPSAPHSLSLPPAPLQCPSQGSGCQYTSPCTPLHSFLDALTVSVPRSGKPARPALSRWQVARSNETAAIGVRELRNCHPCLVLLARTDSVKAGAFDQLLSFSNYHLDHSDSKLIIGESYCRWLHFAVGTDSSHLNQV